MPNLLSIQVQGQVQGVFFRVSARDKAQKLGLVGFVRNEPDGSVYLEAQGKQASLEKFLAWCHQGSNFSKITKVESKPIKSFSQIVEDSFLIL